MDISIFATALAQTAEQAAPKGPSIAEMLILPLGFMFIMYFFMIRPQQRKAREHSDFVQNLKAGDEVVTTGGIIGKVRSVAETFVTVEVANNTSIKVLKNNVAALTKQQPQGAAQQAPAKS